MKTRLLAAGAAFLVLGAAASAAPIVNTFAVIGPNANGSPSFTAFSNNAIAGLIAGPPPAAVAAGTPGTPAFYNPMSLPANVTNSQITGTQFPSFNGIVGGTERGNLLYFSVSAVADPAGKISANQITFSVSFADAGTGTTLFSDSFTLDQAITNPLFQPYLQGRVGGGAFAPITNGAAQYDQIIFRGAGYGDTATVASVDGNPLYGNGDGVVTQAEFNRFLLDTNPFRITGQFTTAGGTGNGAAVTNVRAGIAAIPAPPSAVLLVGMGICTVAARGMRRLRPAA
jgi:hypothetical protein